MHAVREELLEDRLRAAGVPLVKVPIPAHCSNARLRSAQWLRHSPGSRRGRFSHGFRRPVPRRYSPLSRREAMRRWHDARLSDLGLPTAGWLVRWWPPACAPSDLQLIPGSSTAASPAVFSIANCLSELPPTMDPCGENGEFHSFAFAGTVFSHPVRRPKAANRGRDGFVFADVLSESASPSLP